VAGGSPATLRAEDAGFGQAIACVRRRRARDPAGVSELIALITLPDRTPEIARRASR